MRLLLVSLGAAVLFASATVVVVAQDEGETPAPAEDAQPTSEDTAANEPLPEEYSCKSCHSKDGELWTEDNPVVTEEDLAGDIHWQKGLRCHDCHGGSPTLEEYEDHRVDPSFHSLEAPGDLPGFCGRCHSDLKYMRRFNPSARTDQETEFWTSGHGLRLKENKDDEDVATCTSCHGYHDIRAANDLASPVYPTRVATTCAECHSDPERMEGREYNGKPLGHDQYDDWKKSVHAKLLLKEGDLSAPTCNDCHGNHGAAPPEVGSVANACGSCHVKVAKLFADTRMKHHFEQADWDDLPGCAACHGNHQIVHPTDDMLGMGEKGFCGRCHGDGDSKYPAALAGKTAQTMSQGLQKLKDQIAAAEKKLDEAEYLGMEVRETRFQLRKADDALTNARALVHGFAIDPMKGALDEGLAVAVSAQEDAQKALEKYAYRRVWLFVSLVPILIAVVLLLLYIRSLPIPGR